MNKVLKITVLLLLVSMALSGVLFAGCSSSGPEIGKLAPDFTLTGLDGQEVSLSGFRGQPVLLNFWATWCGPCSMEMPFLQDVYEKWTGKGPVSYTHLTLPTNREV